MTCLQSGDYFSTNSVFTRITLPIIILVIVTIISNLSPYHSSLYILGTHCMLNTIIDEYLCMNTEESKELGV